MIRRDHSQHPEYSMKASLLMRDVRTLTIGVAFIVAMTVTPMACAEEGMATHYNDTFQGKPTANGQTFDQEGMTAAHMQYPFGTKVIVTNLTNNRSVEVTINDRMARRNRNVIDLTRRAARELGFEKNGRTRVSLAVVQ
jgi:rare lipoprotein A